MYKVRTRIGMIIMSVLLLIGMAPTVANLPVGNADGTAYAAGSNTVEYSVGWHASQDNKINISYTSSNRGWVYYIVRNAGSDAPTLQEVINNNEYFPQTLDSYGRKSGSTAAKVNSTSA